MLEISTLALRNLIKDKILSDSLHLLLPKVFTPNNRSFPQGSLLHYVPNEAFTLANYYYLIRLAELVGYHHYVFPRHNTIQAAAAGKGITELSTKLSSPHGVLPMIGSLCYEDLEEANLFICVAAWLSTDSFKWHDLNPMIPSDLSYGMVTQYYDYLVPFCCVVADYRREELVKAIPPDRLSLIKTQSIKDVIAVRPNCKNIKELQGQLQTI